MRVWKLREVFESCRQTAGVGVGVKLARNLQQDAALGGAGDEIEGEKRVEGILGPRRGG